MDQWGTIADWVNILIAFSGFYITYKLLVRDTKRKLTIYMDNKVGDLFFVIFNHSWTTNEIENITLECYQKPKKKYTHSLFDNGHGVEGFEELVLDHHKKIRKTVTNKNLFEIFGFGYSPRSGFDVKEPTKFRIVITDITGKKFKSKSITISKPDEQIFTAPPEEDFKNR